MQVDKPDFEKSSGADSPESRGWIHQESQDAFEHQYMTAPEIRDAVGITTPAVYAAVRAGKFPAPVARVPGCNVWLWLRTQAEPAITAWRDTRAAYGPTQHVGRAGA